MPSKVFTCKQLAKEFNVNERTVRKWFEKNKIQGFKFHSNEWKVTSCSLKIFIEKYYPDYISEYFKIFEL